MIKIKVLDRIWKVSVLDENKFQNRLKLDAGAVTLPATYEIIFCEEELCPQVVIHELGHAYFESLCVSTCHLRKNQMEEVFVEMFAIHGETILKQAKSLHRRLLKEIKY